jgi:diacylglycerol kinase family enzyme
LTFAAVPMKILSVAEGDQNRWDIRSDQPTLLAAFANTPLYGGGMKIAPRARMDDGLLDVCVVGAVDRLRLMRLLPTVYSGRHLEVPEVDYFQSQRVRVKTEQPLDVYADGEYVCRTPVEVGVERGVLRVVTGYEAPQVLKPS